MGFTRNQPGSLAVEQAIEQAVLQFIVEGSARGLWAFRDKAFQSRIIENYELSYLMAQAKPGKFSPQTKVADAKGQAPSPAKTAGVAPQPAAATAGQPKPVQQASLPAPAPGQPPQQPKLAPAAGPQQPAPNPQWVPVAASNTQPMQQPAPQIIVQPRTLEDEVSIAVR